MNSPIFTKIVLTLAGLIALAVGVGIVFFAAAFHGTSGIVLDGNLNLTNEMRAAGGPILVGGLLMLAGAFARELSSFATGFATIMYLSYGFARIVSFVIDGIPSRELVQIAALEIIVGLVCGAALVVSRPGAPRLVSPADANGPRGLAT